MNDPCVSRNLPSSRPTGSSLVSSRKHSFAESFAIATILVITFMLAGCSVQTPAQRSDSQILPSVGSNSATQSAPDLSMSDDTADGMDYDPWEPVNERTFYFNYNVLDRYGLKPAATVWDKILPEPVTLGLANAFINLDMPKRFINNVLQGRLEGANRELFRFLINSTVGVAGLFDVATRLGLQKSYADTGQTLGTYGISPGPYLVVPFLPPLTVRDGIGYAADTFLDPLSYFIPFFANFGRAAARRINERAVNLHLYDGVEESSLDLYAAVRNGYLQQRQHSVERAEKARDDEAEWVLLRKVFSRNNTPAGSDSRTSENR
jgi:phospholipid-binding lipoprotein MlaA